MIKDVIAEVAVRREARIVHVFNVIAFEPVAPLIGALARSACFIVTPVGEQLVADMAIRRHPHPHVGMGNRRGLGTRIRCSERGSSTDGK